MSKNNLPNCTFCGQKFTEDELDIKLIVPAKFVGNEQPNGDIHYRIKGDWDEHDYAHLDCWEARNRLAPARRKIIKITKTRWL